MSEDSQRSGVTEQSFHDWDAVLNIFAALSTCALLLDRSGIIRAANRTFLDTVGLSSDEIENQPAEILEPYLAGLKEQLAELRGDDSRTFHARLTDKNGKALFVEFTLVQIERQGSSLVVCIGRNLQKLTGCQEAALRRTEQQLMAANRLKRKFIANINHAIRTPMNAIIGYAEILAESGLNEQQQRFVSTIRKNGTALVSIINDVMELSKLETGNVKVLKSAANLHAVIEQAADMFADQLRAKKLEFLCAVEPGLPEMYVMDADHCRQVLINLISNAVKFTEKGKVCLTVTGTEAGPDCWELSFQVADTGIGMSIGEQQGLIELFEQQDVQVSIDDGTRLGLTLCARLARMMGGSIRLESILGQGTAFTFIMPVQAADKAGSRPEDGFAGQSCGLLAAREKGTNPVMLVVDDMPEMSHLVKIYFTNSPIKVLEAAGPDECLALALSEQPDLILMDLNLAGADGRDLAQQLKEDQRTAQIPIVAMTGFMLDKDSLTPLFDDLLAKPFHLQELQRVVDRYIQIDQNSAVETVHPWHSPSLLVPNLSPIRAVWDSGLQAAYAQAQMSGNLEDAFALGRSMEDCGRKTGTTELTAMGKDMKRFALDIDIRGVEQVLTALRSVAEEK
ncbi:MAG: PAS domain S-box-containing protein [Candidatus Electronema aureum]|uniref:histidine kinase n=1 Tax=Candidatus Electronema aureum TaxID=2005002 RepID=A0A521FYZ9_9BACT|nr:MAG: PAS domain S-box-containing protein [Candidatus Electronema aureum]